MYRVGYSAKQRLPAYIIEEPLPPSLSEETPTEDEKEGAARKYRADIEMDIHLNEYYSQLRKKYIHRDNFKIPAMVTYKLKLVTSYRLLLLQSQ